MVILGIDPGNEKSAYVLWNTESEKLLDFGIVENEDLLHRFFERDIELFFDELAIEMIASYGMPVGKSVFDTCVWIGRFIQFFSNIKPHTKVYRKDVKMHLCGTPRAKDGNIRQALIDKYGPPGIKKAPGKLYGVSKDVWAALAVAVTFAEMYDIIKENKA